MIFVSIYEHVNSAFIFASSEHLRKYTWQVESILNFQNLGFKILNFQYLAGQILNFQILKVFNIWQAINLQFTNLEFSILGRSNLEFPNFKKFQ